MLQTHTDSSVVTIVCLLQWSAYIQADKIDVVRTNYSAEFIDIIENFTELVNLPWDFSNEEDFKLLQLPNLAHDLCQLGFWCIFQCNFSLMDNLREIHRFQRAVVHEEGQYYLSDILHHLENATELQKNVTLLLKKLIPKIQEISLQHTSKNDTNYSCSRRFLDLHNLKNQLEKYTKIYYNLKNQLLIIHAKRNIILYYSLPFLVAWFMCGMVGNGLLLFIFARHSETRSGPNALLVNLAVSDTIFLVISVTVEHFRVLWGIPFRTYGCYVYHFLLTCITAVSVYSMTALSFMRYVAITIKMWNNAHKLLVPMPVVLSVVWISSSLVAIPDTLYTVAVETSNETFFCSVSVDLPNTITNFIFISFLPLIAITFFYISVSKRLQESICNLPGESIGHEKIKIARKNGAKIFPAQTFVFAITYLPFYTYWLVDIFMQLDDNLTSTTIYLIVYILFNFSSTLNPIALYLVSSMIRNYFHKYLSLGLTKKQTAQKNSPKCYALSSGV